MRKVEITGIGLTRVGEHFERGLADLALEAVSEALRDARGATPTAFFVGSAFSGVLAGQEHLGAFLADRLGLGAIEVHRVEADGASGASALRLAELAVGGGAAECALVLGIEKTSDLLPDAVERAKGMALDSEHEAALGITPAAAAALLLSRYLHEHRIERSMLGAFPLLAHKNAVTAAHAFMRREISPAAYDKAAPVARPLRVLDCAPDADGAAALVVQAAGRGVSGVRITGSAVATGPVALAARKDPLLLEPAAASVRQALDRAGRTPKEVSFFELDDTYSITAALSLEAAGLADRGHAARRASEGDYALSGELPICTFGGNKARGNPIGAAGLYRVAEAVLQLRGAAGDNQVRGARVALVQSLGGLGATAITHVLE